VLRWTAIGGAVLASGCGDNTEPPADHHGGFVLESTTDSFVLVVWSDVARMVWVDVTAETSDDNVFATGAFVEAERAIVRVTGLAADTPYVITTECDDGVRLIHRARTAPSPDATRAVRIAVSADVDPAPDFVSDLVQQLVATAPELYISLGDFPYTDDGPPAQDVPAYRARYARMLVEPNVRVLCENVAIRAIYDDHEFRNDWDKLYAINEATRFAAAMQAWNEFFPIGGDVRYRSWRWGAHLELFLLDCRFYRDPNHVEDTPSKTMLGATQRAWLIDAVTRSTATFKVVLTSVPLDYGDGVDHWSGFVYEREAILDALAGVTGLLFVSADQHWFADQVHSHGIREFQVGPLARGLLVPTRMSKNVRFRASRFNVGVIETDGTNLTFSALGVGGEVFYKQTLSIADLTPTSAR
jgi:alkaline phosphatase D